MRKKRRGLGLFDNFVDAVREQKSALVCLQFSIWIAFQYFFKLLLEVNVLFGFLFLI
jgi:hypothetical protein